MCTEKDATKGEWAAAVFIRKGEIFRVGMVLLRDVSYEDALERARKFNLWRSKIDIEAHKAASTIKCTALDAMLWDKEVLQRRQNWQ